jgi:hypothetical protein
VAGLIGQWRWAITCGLLLQLGAALLFAVLIGNVLRRVR